MLKTKYPNWKYAFMGLLLDAFETYKNNTYTLGTQPQAIVRATKQYIMKNDTTEEPLGKQFIEMCCEEVSEEDGEGWIEPKEFYLKFKEWAKATQEYDVHLIASGQGRKGYQQPDELKGLLKVKFMKKDCLMKSKTWMTSHPKFKDDDRKGLRVIVGLKWSV